MAQPPPATIGMPLAAVDTPALLIDLDAFEANLGRMADFVKRAGVRLRPHSKTHKSPDVAARQIALGAVGVCCQKVSEAEAMVAGGVGDVLVSNEVAGTAKLDRLAQLARRAKVGVCVDDPAGVDEIEAAAARADTPSTCWSRSTSAGGAAASRRARPAARLARLVASSPHLRFAGLQAYHGSAQHIREAADRKSAIAGAVERVKETLRALRGRAAWRPPTSPGRAPAPTRTRRGAASTPSCRPAPTCSWTPTMPATSAATGVRSTPSATPSSSTPPP